ncbi:MAG: phage terminase large subunit [Lutibacter sp.]|jgi:hypothetical protein
MQTVEATSVYKRLHDAYDPKKQQRQEKQGFVLEGAGGSGKTFAIMDFLIIDYCQSNINKGKKILILRQQYSDIKDSVLSDFLELLVKFGMYREEYHSRSNPQNYDLLGNHIMFRGLDAMGAHGKRNDVIWINEAMEADKDAFDQLNQRCNDIFILDYNPYFTEHWIYNSVITRPDVTFFHCPLYYEKFDKDGNFIKFELSNPLLPSGQLSELLSREPTHPEDRHLPEKDRRPHPTNITNGTADDTLWKVYGLGLRAQHEGVIFRHVNWIDQFPDNVRYWYGIDWGFTNDKTALVKIYVDENSKPKKIFAKELCYVPIDNPAAVSELMQGLGVERNIRIIADSSDKYVSATKGGVEMVKDLKSYGWNIEKVSKTHDRYYWITKAKEYQLNIVRSPNFKKEQENWCWRTVAGVRLNQPIDKFDHLWSAMLYGLMGGIKKPRKMFW